MMTVENLPVGCSVQYWVGWVQQKLRPHHYAIYAFKEPILLPPKYIKLK